jgi:N-hydroxyarylamine O-acetyltransferase
VSIAHRDSPTPAPGLDIRAYLARIGYEGGTEPTLDNLRAMHRAHCLNVPFENLDIARGVPIVVDEAVNVDKIVRLGRGGFCLELTGTFARALRALGYRVDVIGAQVELANTPPPGGAAGAASRTFEWASVESLDQARGHMIAIVHLDEPWLADVGFGGRIIEPLRLHEPGVQRFGFRSFTVATDGERWRVACEEPGAPPGSYQFLWRPRSFDDFHDICIWLQTSPDSRFTRGDIVSLATPEGRITLAEGRLIVSEQGVRNESDITSPEEKAAILRERFGITL